MFGIQLLYSMPGQAVQEPRASDHEGLGSDCNWGQYSLPCSVSLQLEIVRPSWGSPAEAVGGGRESTLGLAESLPAHQSRSLHLHVYSCAEGACKARMTVVRFRAFSFLDYFWLDGILA